MLPEEELGVIEIQIPEEILYKLDTGLSVAS